MKKIFAVNLGSTSTKVAYYEDENCVCRESIAHDISEFAGCANIFEQKELRKTAILRFMAEHGISMDKLDAFVTRGGQTEPVSSGVYEINEAYATQAMSGKWSLCA